MRQRNFLSAPDFNSARLSGKFVIWICSFVMLLALGANRSLSEMIPRNFCTLAETAGLAVVNIRTVKLTQDGGRVFRHFFRGPFDHFDDDDPMKEHFDRFFEQDPNKEFKQRSLGSGFLIDIAGYIVTNNHVVENADQITVQLNNGKEFDARIIGRDPNTDIALIKIDPVEDLPFVEMGDSDEVKVGQWVVAIGNPFGLEHTVTAGIVSAKGRVLGSGPYDDFIQTDASINPGNSGGPLIDLEGKVVGINTAIVAGGQGIGFAIPVNMAKDVIRQLKHHGEVVRGWLGVGIQPLNPELVEYYGIKNGVLVTDVFPGDPADIAGLKAKDVITAVNGRKIETPRDLTGIVACLTVGDHADIDVVRNGEMVTLNVKIGRRPDTEFASRVDPEDAPDEIGIQVENIDPEIARKFNITDGKGVVVVGVTPGGKGEKAGILEGDLIKEINHQEIFSVNDYQSFLSQLSDGEVIQLFIRRAATGFMVIKLDK
ncbi:MAG: Do family serine endopeptidase [Desulfobacterales bacterium]